ncbi:unnamed protein product, partial [Symbiodinium sp. KB8]
GCWAAAQIVEIETSATYVLKKERRPTKTREYDWKIRAARGHDEKVVKVGAISNRKLDRDHMRAWKAFLEKISFDIFLPELKESRNKIAAVKKELPSTGTPRSTPRSDPAPPSVEQRSGERCESEPKETPGSGNRSEHSTPVEAAEGQSNGSALAHPEDGPEQEPQSALNELNLYEQLLDPEVLRRPAWAVLEPGRELLHALRGIRDLDVVPVDYANAQLWSGKLMSEESTELFVKRVLQSYRKGATLEYENLLNTQRDQHEAVLKQMEAENFRLRQAVQMLQSGRGDEGFAAAQLKMREEEHRLALEAKQREIDLITSLVRVRDQQVREMQKLTGSKQVHQKLEELRSEKAQVEQLLLAKEKQLAAVQAVDPQMADASALQLGAQAIQMFHDSLRMKQDASTLARENEELRGQVDDLQVQLQEAQGSVTEKRREVKELAANLSTKMKRIIELEEQVERSHREGRAMAQAATSKLAKEEIAERDRRFMKQQVISRRHETSAAELQQQVADLRSRLAQADAALRGMASSNTFKDRVIHDMTEQELLGSGPLAREREAATPSAGLRLLRDAEAAMRSPSPSGGTTPGSLISKVPGARVPQPLEPPGESALPSPSAPPAFSGAPREPTATAGQRGPTSSINLPTAAIETVLLAEAYRPHPDDPIDEKVAGFANQPKNSASKALFCRLGPGSYLFGTQRVSVRLSPRTGDLEARAGGDWMSIEAPPLRTPCLARGPGPRSSP